MATNRPICATCGTRPRAVAYHRYGRIYYRSQCDICIRRGKKLIKPEPRWRSAGYQIKPVCDVCGFRARLAGQLAVYHVNGDLRDVSARNLKTVCRNCMIEIASEDLPWRRGDLEEDR